jgi:tetratricopeptide (TPR) repeat protein
LDAALESAEYALSLNTKDIHSLTKYAEILARMNRKDEALQTLQDAQKLMPNEISLYTHLSNNLVQMNFNEEAILAAEEGLTRTNDKFIQVVLRLNCNVAYRQLGQYEKALEDYENISTIKLSAPYDKMFSAYVDTEKGVINFLKRDYAQAQTDFLNATRNWSPHTIALLYLAAAQYVNGEIEAAYKTWQRFQETPTRLHNIGRLHREGYVPESLLNVIDKIAVEQPPQFYIEQNLSVMRDGDESAASQKS